MFQDWDLGGEQAWANAVWGLCFGVEGSKYQALGFLASDLGFRVWGYGFRV